jgi:hypothetical protein
MGYLAATRDVSHATMRRGLFFASALGSFCVEGIGPSRLLAIQSSELAARITSFARLVDYGGGLELPR